MGDVAGFWVTFPSTSLSSGSSIRAPMAALSRAIAGRI